MARPIAARRHDEIMRRVTSDGSVSVEEMAGVFAVSRETIRRDLKVLADRGRLAIVHGGAARKSAEIALSERMSENPAGKARIGRAAARMVEDGMVVLLDSGATTLGIADALVARIAAEGLALTICTNSLPIALVMARTDAVRVHVLAGEVDRTDEAVFGADAVAALSRFRFDLAFVGAGGISDRGEITDFTREAADLRSRMIEVAGRAYIVADHGKFARLTPIRIESVHRAAGLIVDIAPPQPIREAIERKGIPIVVASD